MLESLEFLLDEFEDLFFRGVVAGKQTELRFMPHFALGTHIKLELIIVSKSDVLDYQFHLNAHADKIGDEHHELIADFL